jgi:aspartate racemase
MKTIGLLGGMSWESTVTYYRLVNEAVRVKMGGLHSAPCVLYSVDFETIEARQRSGDWASAGRMLAKAACALERAGAEFLVLCTNTMHKVVAPIEAATRIPLLHIADATGQAICRTGIGRVGLLGTRFTMEEDFYRGRLSAEHGLEVVTPAAKERAEVDRIIFDELCRGQVRPESRQRLADIMRDLERSGAEGVILGCTELGLLVGDGESAFPIFDTTRIHALAAVERACAVPAD